MNIPFPSITYWLAKRFAQIMLLCTVIIPVLAEQVSGSKKFDLGLPVLANPDDNRSTSQKIALGRRLFFDNQLSEDGKISCASCHKSHQAFSDGIALARGVRDSIGSRNTPTLLNAAFNSSFFWEGRRKSLEMQALDPLINPREHGLKNLDELVFALRKDKDYLGRFYDVFGVKPDEIRPQHIGQALAAFERTLVAGNSSFDRYEFLGEKHSLSESAERGLVLFRGRAQCVNCHHIGSQDALFTDNKFHSLSVGLQKIEKRLPIITTRLISARQTSENIDQTIIGDDEIAELGLFAVTLNPNDIGKFRTPSLRNVAMTAPYMHDGSIETLEEVVEWETYYRNGDASRPLALTLEERADLVEFLKSLTSDLSQIETSFSP